MAFLTRHANKLRVEGADQLEVRFNPSPCCARDKREGSTVVNTRSGLWNCHACGHGGNWFTLTRAFGDPLAADDRYENASPVDFSVYDKIRAKLRRPVTANHYPQLFAYCKSRGFSETTLNAWRVSTQGERTLRWPIYAKDVKGAWQIVNARMRVCLGRDEHEGTKDWFETKGGPTELMIGNHLLDVDPVAIAQNDPANASTRAGGVSGTPQGSKRILVTEGQWDAMTGFQLGIPNCLSLSHGGNHVNVSSMLRYIPEDWEVWLAVDMDKTGDRCAELFFAQLGPERVARLMMPHKDLNAWLMAEPDLTAEKVLATAKGMTRLVTVGAAATVSSEPRFVSIDEEEGEGDAAASPIVCQTPWDRLTRRLDGGLRAAQTTGLLAPSGIGKTTVVNQIAVHAAKQGVTVGIVSLESARGEVRSKLRDQLIGWTNYTGEAFKDTASRLLLSELEGKTVTWKQCIAEFKRMVKAGARLLIWDNPDYIMGAAMSSNAVKLQAYAEFQNVCHLAAAHGIVVWQPLKIDRDAVINSGHQKGMSQALQDSDNYLNLNRFGRLRRIETEKARVDETIENLRYVWIKYDATTKCLNEIDHQADLAPVGEYGTFPEKL